MKIQSWKWNTTEKTELKLKNFVFGSDVDPKGHYIILASGELGVVACRMYDVDEGRNQINRIGGRCARQIYFHRIGKLG